MLRGVDDELFHDQLGNGPVIDSPEPIEPGANHHTGRLESAGYDCFPQRLLGREVVPYQLMGDLCIASDLAGTRSFESDGGEGGEGGGQYPFARRRAIGPASGSAAG